MPTNRVNYGLVVKDGVLRYTSPSAIARFDPTAVKGGGCMRKWFFRYVLRFPDKPSGKGQEIGNTCHDQLDRYVTTGDAVLDRITLAARRFAPQPKAIGVYSEIPLGGINADFDQCMLSIHGVPIVMYLDIVDRRGCYLDDEGEFYKDPLDTIEYLDWKFGKEKMYKRDGSRNKNCYASTEQDLAIDIQMLCGGAGVLNRFGGNYARLSHVYTNYDGTPHSHKTSVLMEAAEVWLSLRQIADNTIDAMKEVAREVDPERVPGNQFACEAFGGCPYMENCSTWKERGGLESYYGTHSLGDLEMTTGILAGFQLPGMPAPTPQPSVTIPLQGAPQFDVGSQLASLGAPPAWIPAQPTQEFVDAVGMINAKGYGFPPLAGVAAQMFGVINQHNVTKDHVVAGFGTLGSSNPISEPGVLVAAARDLAAYPDKRPSETRVAQILPPSAPQNNPALAADPMPGYAHPAAVTPNVQVPGLIASVPAATGAVIMANTATAAPADTGIPPVKEKRTRRTKAQMEAARAAGEAPIPGEVAVHVADDARWLFVNTHPNIDAIDLAPWIHNLHMTICKHNQLPIADVRTAGKDHPLGFGAWKGHITALAAKAAGSLAPGAYYLRVYPTDEITQCALDGLRTAKKGDTTEMVFDLICTGQ